ncbi:hypothetical protein U1Q18_000409 [Sarracenia purpurea var. burkii]
MSTFNASRTLDFSQFAKPFRPPKILVTPFLSSPRLAFTVNLGFKTNSEICIKPNKLKIRVCRASTLSSNSVLPSAVQEEDPESTQLFEKLKDAERERINKLEELERKANIQLERQLVMASDWSRKLLTMRGKLKGTEWDPEHSHRIDYSEFLRLLNSNNVQFMEYSNYGQTISEIDEVGGLEPLLGNKCGLLEFDGSPLVEVGWWVELFWV